MLQTPGVVRKCSSCRWSERVCCLFMFRPIWLLWCGWYFLTSWTRLQNGRHRNQKANPDLGAEFDIINKKDKKHRKCLNKRLFCCISLLQGVLCFLNQLFANKRSRYSFNCLFILKWNPKDGLDPDYSFETFKKTCHIQNQVAQSLVVLHLRLPTCALLQAESLKAVISMGEKTLNICLKVASGQKHSKLNWPIQIVIGKILQNSHKGWDDLWTRINSHSHLVTRSIKAPIASFFCRQ